MHKIYFLFFLLLMGTTVFAQRKGTIHQRQIIIPPAQNTQVHSKAGTTFNESGFIPVKKGDSIFIQPDVVYPAKDHHILRGVFKTLGLGALAYQTNKTLHPFGGEGTVNQQANQSIIPSLGIGFALSYPDFAGKPNKSNLYLRFLLYGKDSVPVAQKTVRLNKKTSIPIKGEVEKDGYIKVILTDNPKSKIISNDLVLNIQSVGQDENVASINTSTSAVVKTISDTTLSTSDTTALKKLIPIRAFDEDDGEEGGDGGGGYGGGDPGDPSDPGDGGCDDPTPDPTTTTNTYQDGNELYSEVCTTTYPDCNGDGGGTTCETIDLGPVDYNVPSVCDPISDDYDATECDEQICDESSANYDPSACEENTCDPSSVNYDETECDEQVCDESSVNYDPSACEETTCDPSSVNYDETECDEQVCDESSVNYDPDACTGVCDPSSPNYDQSTCETLHLTCRAQCYLQAAIDSRTQLQQYRNDKKLCLLCVWLPAAYQICTKAALLAYVGAEAIVAIQLAECVSDCN
jgi:hypothetical protein